MGAWAGTNPWSPLVLPATVLAAYLALVPPILGRARYRRLEQRLAVEPGLRMRAYRNSLRRSWLLAVLSVCALGLAGLPASEGGLSLRVQNLDELLPALVVLLVLAAGLGFGLRALPAARHRLLWRVSALLPQTRGERQLFALVAVTAGVTEEIVYRGFLLAYLVDVFPGVSVGSAMVISSLLFGLAHTYQRPLGVLLTGLAGYSLASIYISTGSLLLPVLIHALVDLRLLVVLPATPEPAHAPERAHAPDPAPADVSLGSAPAATRSAGRS